VAAGELGLIETMGHAGLLSNLAAQRSAFDTRPIPRRSGRQVLSISTKRGERERPPPCLNQRSVKASLIVLESGLVR
jgi:hypothetical protein